jgi:hypothetical protein
MLVWPGMTPSWRSQRTEIEMPSELDDIRTKLKAARTNAEKARQAAQRANESRDADPFLKDRERMAQLQIAEMWDKHVVKLEFEERCALPAGGSNEGGWKPAGAIFYGADG